MARLTLQLLGGFSARLGSGQALALGNEESASAHGLSRGAAGPGAFSGQAGQPARGATPGTSRLGKASGKPSWPCAGRCPRSSRPSSSSTATPSPSTRRPSRWTCRPSSALRPAAAPKTLEAADRRSTRATCWRGSGSTEEPFEDWLRAERARLRERALDVLTRLLALPEQGRRDRTRGAHGGAPARARSPAGDRASDADAPVCPPGTAGRGVTAIPGLRQRLQRELRAEPERRRSTCTARCCSRRRRAIGPPDAPPAAGAAPREARSAGGQSAGASRAG